MKYNFIFLKEGTWWNSQRWVLSIDSLRKTRSTEKYFLGVKPPSWFAAWYSICAEMAVVWVRSKFLNASFCSNTVRYPMLP